MYHPDRHSPSCAPRTPRRSGRAARRRGFTAVELAVTMAVAVVMLALAAPRFADFTASNQLGAVRSSFAASVALARTEAARLGLPVLVAAVAGGPTGNEYGNGWEVVVDSNGDGAADASEPRVRQYPALNAAVKLSGTRTLALRATGALNGNAAQVFTACRSDGTVKGYSVTVTPSGGTDVALISNCP